MNAQSSAEAVPERNRTLTAMGVSLIVASTVVGIWLATVIGDVVTAAWMILFVVVGLVFVSLGRNAGVAS